MGKKHLLILTLFISLLLMIIGCGDKDSGIAGYAMYDDGEAPAIPQGIQAQSYYMYSNPTLEGYNEKRFKAVVKWNKVTSNISGGQKDNIIGYKIYRNIKNSPIGIVDKDTLIFEDNDTDLKEGRTYTYFVAAFDSLLRETFSDGQSVRISATSSSGHTPGRPMNLVLVRESNDSATLVWEKPENISDLAEANDPLDSYIVYRRIGDAGSWSIVAKVPSTTFFFNDPTVTEGTRYYYKVKAVTSTGLIGLDSEEKSIIINYDYNDDGYAPVAPEIQSVIIPNDISGNARKVTWNSPEYDDNAKNGSDSAGDVLGYKIYRSTQYDNANSPYQQVAIVSNTTSWTDENILDSSGNPIDYYYKVSAYDYSGNNSDKSQPLKVGLTPVTKPTGFTGSLDTYDEITLNWYKMNGYGYKVYESKNGRTFREFIHLSESQINQSYLIGSTVSYSPRKILDDETYYYKISAVSESNQYESNKTYFIMFKKGSAGTGAQSKVVIEAENVIPSIQVRSIVDAVNVSFSSGWGLVNSTYYELISAAKTVGSNNYQYVHFNPRGPSNENSENYPYDYWWNDDGSASINTSNPTGIGQNTQYRYQEQIRIMFMPQTDGKYNITIHTINDSECGYYSILPRTDSFVLAEDWMLGFNSGNSDVIPSSDITWNNVNLNAYETVYFVFSAYKPHSTLGTNHAINIDKIEIERVD